MPHDTLDDLPTAGTQNYPWPMARRLALLIAADNEEELAILSLRAPVETAFPVEDVDAESSPEAYKYLMKELRAKFDAELIAKIATLHDQFGHPSARGLAAACARAEGSRSPVTIELCNHPHLSSC